MAFPTTTAQAGPTEARPVFVANGMAGSIPLEAEDFVKVGLREGRAYSISTGTVSIPQGSRLKAELYNPPASGVRLWVYREVFSNDRQGTDQMLVRNGRPAFGAPLITGGTAITPVRLNNPPESPRASLATASFLADDSAPITNTAVGEVLPLNGIRVDNAVIFVLYPGNGFVYEIEGSTGGVIDAARASIFMEYYEEDYP